MGSSRTAMFMLRNIPALPRRAARRQAARFGPRPATHCRDRQVAENGEGAEGESSAAADVRAGRRMHAGTQARRDEVAAGGSRAEESGKSAKQPPLPVAKSGKMRAR
jgi:hypothetical protein